MPRLSHFPPHDLSEALILAQAIFEHNAGKPMRRLTLFNVLGRSPESGTSRQLITASSGYGLTQGGYQAEVISLTERGQAIVERGDPQAKIEAVLGVEVFGQFFEHYRNSTFPSPTAALAFLEEHGVPKDPAQRCYEVLLETGQAVALIQEISGVKRVVSTEHALETLSAKAPPAPGVQPAEKAAAPGTSQITVGVKPQSPTVVPTIHIDLQIHISPDADPGQIDLIFAAMAKHLYLRG